MQPLLRFKKHPSAADIQGLSAAALGHRGSVVQNPVEGFLFNCKSLRRPPFHRRVESWVFVCHESMMLFASLHGNSIEASNFTTRVVRTGCRRIPHLPGIFAATMEFRMRKAVLVLLSCAGLYAAAIPRPEYPQPQFQRERWLSLNGAWEFEFDDANAGLDADWASGGKKFSRNITVPYCFESRLSGIGD